MTGEVFASDSAAAASVPIRLRDVTSTQWHAFTGAFLGWVLDGFDFSILTYLLIDIQHSFTVPIKLSLAL